MTNPKTSYTQWIDTEELRSKLLKIIANTALPFNAHLKRDTRTEKQNRRQWALLRCVSEQIVYIQNVGYLNANEVEESMIKFAARYKDHDWKDFFCHSLAKARWMPSEDGGFIPLSTRTSKMTKDEHSQLTALIVKFGDDRGVDFGEHKLKEQDESTLP